MAAQIEAAMDMIEPWQSADEAETALLQKLANKEKIMGFGPRYLQ